MAEPVFHLSDPWAYFDQVVVPCFEEYLANNASVRHAMVALIVTNHMHDWSSKDGKGFNRSAFVKANPRLTREADALGLVREIANKSKHYTLTRSRDIFSRKQGGFSSGFSSGFKKPLMLMREDGSEVSVEQVLFVAVDYWRSQRP